MNLTQIIDGFSRWIDMVANAVVTALARIRRVRTVRISEREDGTFSITTLPKSGETSFRLEGAAPVSDTPPEVAAALKGQDVALTLHPARFLFRPLELPKGAAAFLDGIVRAQIDRLTPWTFSEAAYGWTQPAEAADERVSLTVAATARARVTPCLDRLRALGARSIVVSTLVEGAAGSEPVRVMDEAVSGAFGVAAVRRVLFAGLAAASVVATLCVAGSEIAGSNLDAQRDDLNQRIADARRRLLADRDGHSGETAALRALEQRKRDTAPTVLVLEALSRVLPDHTYVTEMQVEGDKVQVIGISREASSLIPLLEQSRHFAQATFVAPTTRTTVDPGEHFHIEARINVPLEVVR